MSTPSQLHRISRMSTVSLQLLACLLLPLLCACSLIYGDYDICNDTPNIATGNHYINLSIVVSSGSESATRAPLGGEDGDGREVGYVWENNVEGITFMLYEVDDEDKGINDVKDEELAFIEYYTVSPDSHEPPGTSYEPNNPSKKEEEATYTTGNQSLKGLDLSKKYRLLVVANEDLTGTYFVGSKVKDVLDHRVPRIHDGSNVGATATKMTMSLEEDYLVDFSKPIVTPTLNGADVTYFFDGIRIERLAARIDFWTKGAEEYKEAEAGQGGRSGYVYPVYKKGSDEKSGDEFVLTAITPFNCYSSTEYLFKRIGNADASEFNYLEDEKAMKGNSQGEQELYVLDPNTNNKTIATVEATTSENGGYRKFLTYELDKIVGDETSWAWTQNPKITIKSIKAANNQWGNTLRLAKPGDSDTIIVCYPKENTLLKDSPLYYYATGLRIEGDYYKAGEENPTQHYTYYGFLRHEGEGTGSYPIYTEDELEEKTQEGTLKGQFPMNFGVVRNNIYRISIDKITQKGEDETPEPPTITWEIKVKKWDKFVHKIINM